ncbi:MAG: KH domain-containing protein [Candidatus Aenigmatarchaeota archaeon]
MYVRVPRDRVAKLVGRGGKTRDYIAKACRCTIEIEGNDVSIEGEALDMLKAGEIVKAIARGFSPKTAMDLISDDTELAVVEMEGTPNTVKRLMGRVIGEHGRARRNIERATGTQIAIKGKTIAIIGPYEAVRAAKKTVEMLLEGRSHAYAWKAMDKMMRAARTI